MAHRIRTHVNPLSITKEHSFDGFKNLNPVIIDVGACKGEFSAALMQCFPDKNFLLFEIRTPLAKRLEEKFKDCKNVKIFDGDAGRNFRKILEPQIQRGVKIETVYVNFPDPWFKDRHKKRRFVTAPFLKECAAYLPKETQFVFQTDQQFLFEETLEVVNASPFNAVEFFQKSPFGIPTDWESAKKQEGAKIWRMRFWKK